MDRDRYARIEANLRKVMESLNVEEATEEEIGRTESPAKTNQGKKETKGE